MLRRAQLLFYFISANFFEFCASFGHYEYDSNIIRGGGSNWKNSGYLNRASKQKQIEDYWLFTGLWHMQMPMIAHPTKDHGYEPFEWSKANEKFYLDNRYEKDMKGRRLTKGCCRVPTQCEVDERGSDLDRFKYYRNDHEALGLHCIFPSLSYMGNVAYRWPYWGALEYQGVPQTPGEAFVSACEGGYEYFTSKENNKACFYPRMRCLYNTKDMIFREPWKDLPMSNHTKRTASGYQVHYHYGYANWNCWIAFCDPVIYAKFSNYSLNRDFGGYYVLEKPLSTFDPCERRRLGGVSRYRKIDEMKWFHVEMTSLKTTTDDSNACMPKDINATPGWIFTLRDMNYQYGFSRAQIEVGVEFSPKWLFSGKDKRLVFIGSKNPNSARKCVGTVISPRHILTAASCVCTHDSRYNVFHGHNGKNCLGKDIVVGEDVYRKTNHKRPGEPLSDVFVYLGEHTPAGYMKDPSLVTVSWVSVMQAYSPSIGEYDVAILGTYASLEFSDVLMPICLMDPLSSDTNILPRGVLIYSIKALKRTLHIRNKYTNANGPSVYQRCRSPCNTKPDSLLTYLRARSKERTRENPLLSLFYFKECDDFWRDFEANASSARSAFHREWLEPQAIVNLTVMDSDVAYETARSFKCYDTRSLSYRFGWCLTQLDRRTRKHNSWGFCDDSTRLNPQHLREHPFYEVETTLVPGSACRVPDGEHPEVLGNKEDDRLTKICTQYVPHKPSQYDLFYFNDTSEYRLERYLGGYYRDFVPRIWRTPRRIKYDAFGQILWDEGAGRKYHVGFPSKYKVCHSGFEDIDVGAPSYFRLSRLRLQNLETKDTTQEPSGQGASHAVLISIQSGWSTGRGKYCNSREGFYSDTETLITGRIHDFISNEVRALQFLNEIYDLDANLVKVQNQAVTTLATTTVSTTTLRYLNSGEAYEFTRPVHLTTTEFDYEFYNVSRQPDSYFQYHYDFETAGSVSRKPTLHFIVILLITANYVR